MPQLSDIALVVSSTVTVLYVVDEFCRRWESMSLTRSEAFTLLHCCSGSLEMAEKVLLEPFQPVWLPVDDALLTSPEVAAADLEGLSEKFGQEAVFARIAYLSNPSSVLQKTENIDNITV